VAEANFAHTFSREELDEWILVPRFKLGYSQTDQSREIRHVSSR
jgi:hypothetical protein